MPSEGRRQIATRILKQFQAYQPRAVECQRLFYRIYSIGAVLSVGGISTFVWYFVYSDELYSNKDNKNNKDFSHAFKAIPDHINCFNTSHQLLYQGNYYKFTKYNDYDAIQNTAIAFGVFLSVPLLMECFSYLYSRHLLSDRIQTLTCRNVQQIKSVLNFNGAHNLCYFFNGLISAAVVAGTSFASLFYSLANDRVPACQMAFAQVQAQVDEFLYNSSDCIYNQTESIIDVVGSNIKNSSLLNQIGHACGIINDDNNDDAGAMLLFTSIASGIFGALLLLNFDKFAKVNNTPESERYRETKKQFNELNQLIVEWQNMREAMLPVLCEVSRGNHRLALNLNHSNDNVLTHSQIATISTFFSRCFGGFKNCLSRFWYRTLPENSNAEVEMDPIELTEIEIKSHDENVVSSSSEPSSLFLFGQDELYDKNLFKLIGKFTGNVAAENEADTDLLNEDSMHGLTDVVLRY